jgi:hypothetical protein
MKLKASRTAALFASAAALSLLATPALAQRGWGGGYGGGGWGHRDHDDTGAWVVGGIIGIGMIAAIASAASKSDKNRRARDRDYDYRDDDTYRNDDYRNNGYRGDNTYRDNRYGSSNRGIDGAVDTCVGEVERGSTRVDTVDQVGRDGDGWRITGRVSGGRSFDCAVDGGGRIRSVTVDGSAVR